MFGYVNIDKEGLEKGQIGLNQTFMCGLCMSTREHFSNTARVTVNFDINFFNVLFHSFLNIDAKLKEGRCASHFIKKRTLLETDEITDKLAVANILLVYLNLYDDVVDGGKGAKKAALRLLKKDYKKASEMWNELDVALNGRYEQLRILEKSNCSSVDIAADPFAKLSEDFCRLVLKEKADDYILTLCYNIGKWIYLIDALDDIKKDLSKGAYNAFVAAYGAKDETFVRKNKDEISFTLYSVLNRIAQCYNDLSLKKYTCLLDNIIFKSIRAKTEQILNRY